MKLRGTKRRFKMEKPPYLREEDNTHVFLKCFKIESGVRTVLVKSKYQRVFSL